MFETLRWYWHLCQFISIFLCVQCICQTFETCWPPSYCLPSTICHCHAVNTSDSLKVLWTSDQSIGSNKTKYIKLNTKTQNIFCRFNENLTTFLYTLTGATKNKSVYKSRMLLKKIWVLVFSFMYLVLVDAMDWSYNENPL